MNQLYDTFDSFIYKNTLFIYMGKKKWTTMIMALEKKQQINKAKKAYMIENKLFKLSDADYVLCLIKNYESNRTK